MTATAYSEPTTPIMIPLKSIELAPGSPLTVHNVTWEQFEAILDELGEKRSHRIAYSQGTLEIRTPLPAHERPHRIIGDLVKVLLDAEERDWEDFGSTTFRHKPKAAGLEPETCFYIGENARRVRACLEQMDLEVYPPPDLAIESDVTSKTTMEAYAALEMPEVWIYDKGKLVVYLFQVGQYVISESSPTFPNVPIAQMIPEWTERALAEGTSTVLRDLRKQLR
jgi:Uma2 family endonuclease